MGKQGCPGGCKATDARRVVSGAPGARGTRPPRAISTPPPTVGRARTVVANPRNRDSDGGGKLRNLFAAYLHPPPSADLGFVKAFSNVKTQCPSLRTLFYKHFNWGDEQGRTMLEAMKYVVQHGEFPRGCLDIGFMNHNNFSDEMKATFERMNATAEFENKIHLE